MDSLVEADQELAINTKRFRNLPRRVIIASKIIPKEEGKCAESNSKPVKLLICIYAFVFLNDTVRAARIVDACRCNWYDLQYRH